MRCKSLAVVLALVSLAAAYQYEVNIFNGIVDAPSANFTWNNVTVSLNAGERSDFLWSVSNASEHGLLIVATDISLYQLPVKFEDIVSTFPQGHLTVVVWGNVSTGRPPVVSPTVTLQNPFVGANDAGVKFVLATDSLAYVNITAFYPLAVNKLMPLVSNQSVYTQYTAGFAGIQQVNVTGAPVDGNRSVLVDSFTATFDQNKDYTAYITANETNIMVYFLEDIELSYVSTRIANFAPSTAPVQLSVYSASSTKLYDLFVNGTAADTVGPFQYVAVPASGNWMIQPSSNASAIPATLPAFSTVVLTERDQAMVVEETENVASAMTDNAIVRIYNVASPQDLNLNIWLDQHALAVNSTYGQVTDYLAVEARNATLWAIGSDALQTPYSAAPVSLSAGARFDVFVVTDANSFAPIFKVNQVSSEAVYKISFLHAVDGPDVYDLFFDETKVFSSISYGTITQSTLQVLLNNADSNDAAFYVKYSDNTTVAASVTLPALLNQSFSVNGADILLVVLGSRDQPQLTWYPAGYTASDSVAGSIQLRYLNLGLNTSQLSLITPGNHNTSTAAFATADHRQMTNFQTANYQPSYSVMASIGNVSVASTTLNTQPNSVYTVALLPTSATLAVQTARLGQPQAQYRVVNLVNTSNGMDVYVDGWSTVSAVHYQNVSGYFLQSSNVSHNVSVTAAGDLFVSYASASVDSPTATNTTVFVIPPTVIGSTPTLVPSLDYNLPYANNTLYVRYVNVGRAAATVVRIGNATTVLPFGAVTPYFAYPVDAFNFYFSENGNQTYAADKQFVGGSAFTVIYEGNGVVQYLYDNGASQPFGPEITPSSNDPWWKTLPVWAWVLIGLGIAAVVGIIIGVICCLCRRDDGATVYQPI